MTKTSLDCNLIAWSATDECWAKAEIIINRILNDKNDI